MPLVTDYFSLYHCPRTAGNWVRRVLEAEEIPHWIEGHVHLTPAESPPDRLSVTIRREPESWLASWRRMVDSGMPFTWDAPRWLIDATTVEDAEDVFAQYACDVTLRTEHIRDDLQALFDRFHLGEVPDLPPENAHGFAIGDPMMHLTPEGHWSLKEYDGTTYGAWIDLPPPLASRIGR